MTASRTTPRRYVLRGVLLAVLVSWRLAMGQRGAEWLAAPDRPTVGDTVWLERTVLALPGWRGRAGKLETAERGGPPRGPLVRGASPPHRRGGRYPRAGRAPR